jgi:hypothetical protein
MSTACRFIVSRGDGRWKAAILTQDLAGRGKLTSPNIASQHVT